MTVLIIGCCLHYSCHDDKGVHFRITNNRNRKYISTNLYVISFDDCVDFVCDSNTAVKRVCDSAESVWRIITVSFFFSHFLPVPILKGELSESSSSLLENYFIRLYFLSYSYSEFGRRLH